MAVGDEGIIVLVLVNVLFMEEPSGPLLGVEVDKESLPVTKVDCQNEEDECCKRCDDRYSWDEDSG